VIGAPGEEGIPGLRPLGAVPGGQGSQVLLSLHGSGLSFEDFLNLPAK